MYWRVVISFLAPVDFSKCRTLPEPTYQREPGLRVGPWKGTVGQQHGHRPTTGSSLKYQEPIIPLWDLEQIKRMASGKNLLDPSEERKGPNVPHICHLFPGGLSVLGSVRW